MAAPTKIDLQYTREDNQPIGFVLNDADGAAVNITTGFAFTMTVNTSDDADAGGTELFQLAGSIVSGPLGQFKFTPTSVNTDLDADVYFYDVQQDTPTRRTIAKGQFEILPQVTLT